MTMICPSCESTDCVKDGSSIRAGGRKPMSRCGQCGYRGETEKFEKPGDDKE